MRELKQRISDAPGWVTLALRAATSVVLFAAFLQFDGYSPVLAVGGIALATLLIYLGSVRVNGFGLVFGLLLEHCAFTQPGLSALVKGLLFAAAVALYFAGLARPFRKQN